MKTKNLACALSMAAVLMGCASDERTEAKLESQAKISRSEAEGIALAKVPGGTVKEGEIEKEKGKLIWSFDIATAGTADITEVQVDAVNGDVVAVEKETPAQQLKEKDKN